MLKKVSYVYKQSILEWTIQWGSNWAIDSLRGTRPAENNILDKEIVVKIIN
jgi:hypothetical protein